MHKHVQKKVSELTTALDESSPKWIDKHLLFQLYPADLSYLEETRNFNKLQYQHKNYVKKLQGW